MYTRIQKQAAIVNYIEYLTDTSYEQNGDYGQIAWGRDKNGNTLEITFQNNRYDINYNGFNFISADVKQHLQRVPDGVIDSMFQTYMEDSDMFRDVILNEVDAV